MGHPKRGHMDANKVYNRLLEINITIDPNPIPNPVYINQKIGECHAFIEEVEKLSINASKETSILQRALNDALASYESEKEALISTHDEIRSLPNIRDREARANSFLKTKLSEINSLKNELSDLNNLSKAINLKLKNLNRANSDIKLQLRLMESQIKLGSSPVSDAAARSLMEEFQKSAMNEDSFKDSETESEHVMVMDPTSPIDTDSLLKIKGFEDDDGKSTDFDHLINPEPAVIKEDRIEDMPEVATVETSEDDNCPIDEEAVSDEETLAEAEKSIKDSTLIDLDQIIGEEPVKQGGDTINVDDAKTVVEPQKAEAETPKEQGTQGSNKIDIDALLSQW